METDLGKDGDYKNESMETKRERNGNGFRKGRRL